MTPEDESGASRVCVFTSAHGTTDSRVVRRECESLVDAGYDVTYYTPFDGDCSVTAVSYGGQEPGTVPSISDRLQWALLLAPKLAGTDYDAYHFHDVELVPTGALLSILTDAPVIYDVHENVEDVLTHKPIFPRPVREPMAKAVSLVEKGLSRLFDGIVAASPDIATRFEEHDRVVTVTNYPRKEWAEGTELKAASDTADEGEIQFVYCGLLSEGRGILTLMAAIDRIPDARDVSLILGGKYANDQIRQEIESRAAGSDRIELVGWLPSLSDVIELFRESDVGVMCFHPDPNKTEAVHRSNKLFQYMATGLPMVVSDVGEWSRLVDDVGCGVAVDPEDPDAIAEAMLELADDPDRRTAMGARGHAAALERFNWDAQRDRLLALYDTLGIERPRADRPEATGEDRKQSASDSRHQTIDR